MPRCCHAAWPASNATAFPMPSAGSRRLRRVIVVAETALAVVVVIGAGLMLRSFAALTNRNPGFEPSRLLTFNTQMILEPDDAARNRVLEAIVERVGQIPGVEAVGGSSGFPVVTAQRGTRFATEGRALTGEQDTAYFMADLLIVSGRRLYHRLLACDPTGDGWFVFQFQSWKA